MKETIFIAMALLTVVSIYTGIPAIARDLDKLGYSRLAAIGKSINIVAAVLISGMVAMGGTLVLMAVNAVLLAGIVTTMVWTIVHKQT